jgi:hypothetical protein
VRQTVIDGRLCEQWDDAALIYRSWDAQGVMTARPYTTAEAAPFITEAARRTITATINLALATNQDDVAQDANVIAQANAIANNPLTTLTAVQIVTVLKQLAQGIAVLAQEDIDTKKELTALIRLAAGLLDTTDGT